MGKDHIRSLLYRLRSQLVSETKRWTSGDVTGSGNARYESREMEGKPARKESNLSPWPQSLQIIETIIRVGERGQRVQKGSKVYGLLRVNRSRVRLPWRQETVDKPRCWRNCSGGSEALIKNLMTWN